MPPVHAERNIVAKQRSAMPEVTSWEVIESSNATQGNRLRMRLTYASGCQRTIGNFRDRPSLDKYVARFYADIAGLEIE
jgi:hypothetical protein